MPQNTSATEWPSLGMFAKLNEMIFGLSVCLEFKKNVPISIESYVYINERSLNMLGF